MDLTQGSVMLGIDVRHETKLLAPRDGCVMVLA